MLKDILRCLRIKHYIKNFLICVPFVFGVMADECTMAGAKKVVIGFFLFCFTSSAIYIMNDWSDREEDKNHPVKSKRPMASGKIKKQQVIYMEIFLLVLVIILGIYGRLSFMSYLFLVFHFILNILYSKHLKKIVICDIVVLSLFYVTRIYYGAAVADVTVSHWLYLTVQCLAVYLGAAKRFGEISSVDRLKKTRKVLEGYTPEYLSSIMQIFLGMALVFYSLWAVSVSVGMAVTVPVVFLTLLKYQYDILKKGSSDPVEVIYEDKCIQMLMLCYVVVVLVCTFFS